jgi:tRNA(fMet)-specific endonuclease VapC
VICEWEAGIQQLKRKEAYRRTLNILLRTVRVWPLDMQTAQGYGAVFHELRRRGKALSQVDMMLAALTRQMGLTLLTTDQDFKALPDLRLENWLG